MSRRKRLGRKRLGCKKAQKIGGKTFILDKGAPCLVYTIDNIKDGRGQSA